MGLKRVEITELGNRLMHKQTLSGFELVFAEEL